MSMTVPEIPNNCELAAGPLGLRNHTVGSHHNLGFELLEHCTVVESVGLVLSALRVLRVAGFVGVLSASCVSPGSSRCF